MTVGRRPLPQFGCPHVLYVGSLRITHWVCVQYCNDAEMNKKVKLVIMQCVYKLNKYFSTNHHSRTWTGHVINYAVFICPLIEVLNIVTHRTGLCLACQTDLKHLQTAMCKCVIPAEGHAPSHHCLWVSQHYTTHSVAALSLRFDGVLGSWWDEVTSAPQTVLRHRKAVGGKIKPSGFLHPVSQVVINTLWAGCCRSTV